jgi:hypothetical protein
VSTVTRRKRASRSNIGPYRRFELLSGELGYPLPQYYAGYGDCVGRELTMFICDGMRAD